MDDGTGNGTGVGTVAGVGFVRRVRRFRGEAINRLTVGGLGLFGQPFVGLLSDEEPLRKRVLFREIVADADAVASPMLECEDVPEAIVPLGTLKDLAVVDLPVAFLLGLEVAADEAATTDTFDSVRRGLGSGRTLRSCISVYLGFL